MNSQWDCIVSKNTCFQQIFMVAEKKSKEIFSTVKEYRRPEVSSTQVLFFFLCVLLLFLTSVFFFSFDKIIDIIEWVSIIKCNSIISLVRYFFVEAYPFKNVCQIEILLIILKRMSFQGKFHLGHSLLLYPHLHFILLSTKNKLNLENDRMLELHRKMRLS